MNKKCFFFLMLLASTIATARAQAQYFEWQGTQRQYLLKMPAQAKETMPIVYFLHGLGDNITRLDNEFHFQQVADAYGWIMVIPQALSQSGATMWNAAMMSSNIDYWKNANHCTGEPSIDTLPDLHNDGLLFVRYSYKGDEELQHIKVIGGNHTWFLNENQTDIAYFKEIHKFFTQGSNNNDGVAETTTHSLRLWPNPTSGQCTIEVGKDTNAELIDLQGRVMATYPLKKGANTIDVSGLSEGLYFIKTTEGAIQKVMVMK